MASIKNAFVRAFSDAFRVAFDSKPLNSEEQSQWKAKLPYFSSSEYIYQARESLPRRKTFSSIVSTPGGLVRVSAAVDTKARVVNQILITGDFFSYPKRAIFDLESLLKNSKASSSESELIIRKFWKEQRPKIPGIEEGHLIQAVKEALEKMELLPHGFDEEESHHLFPVLKPFNQVKRPEILLLPYCAKEVDCDCRNREGCNECGRCSVGDAIQMGRSFGMAPITIQNYEELESVLSQLKRLGVRAFVGSCCEPFYGKHRPDFERIGVPGILVDVERSTCYELGQEKKAFKGQFENQTDLNLSLLQKVLEFSHG